MPPFKCHDYRIALNRLWQGWPSPMHASPKVKCAPGRYSDRHERSVFALKIFVQPPPVIFLEILFRLMNQPSAKIDRCRNNLGWKNQSGQFAMGGSNTTSQLLRSSWKPMEKQNTSWQKLVPGGSSGGSAASYLRYGHGRNRNRHRRISSPTRQLCGISVLNQPMVAVLAGEIYRVCVLTRSSRAFARKCRRFSPDE